jgi:hypothetical protein
MSEPRDLDPTASWEDRLVFRETFLLHLPPAGSAGLRAVGRAMVEAVLALDFRDGPQPGVAARVRALAEDLRVSAQALAWLESGQEAADLSPEESALAMKARSWARDVTEVAQAMEAAAGCPGGPP